MTYKNMILCEECNGLFDTEAEADGHVCNPKFTFEGIVRFDKYGSWNDCSPGTYVGDTHESTISAALDSLNGCNVRITIEEINNDD